MFSRVCDSTLVLNKSWHWLLVVLSYSPTGLWDFSCPDLTTINSNCRTFTPQQTTGCVSNQIHNPKYNVYWNSRTKFMRRVGI